MPQQIQEWNRNNSDTMEYQIGENKLAHLFLPEN